MERDRPLRGFSAVCTWLLPLALASSAALAQDGEAAGEIPIAEEAPATSPVEVIQHLGSGRASYYGRRFHGRPTASGESFDMHAMTAAHRTLPFGSLVRVTNVANGRSVVVRINDRGPFHGNRVIDVSRAAATELGLIAPGSGEVDLELLAS
ncbi:septal ring lytic transglycosylase RlpA family protein [Altererythrobacter litoralis]|uniref:Endolytic peptidoglycan transglycosylase RlpA n=1 Tax=Altererythrobacter litoralis TaxID=3113904 RepID=A0ABU7GB96_9SPHN|nr:septal ring lytic transglycosylase RlpA family protein [Erythrobacteraceae bacterium 1XM1-14]